MGILSDLGFSDLDGFFGIETPKKEPEFDWTLFSIIAGSLFLAIVVILWIICRWRDNSKSDNNFTPQNGSWNHGLFACCLSPFNCLITFFFPCIQYTRNTVAAEDSTAAGCCCGFLACFSFFIPVLDCLMLCRTREKTRKRYGIAGNCCADLAASVFCPCCVLIQTGDQLDNSVWSRGEIQRV